MKSKKLTKEEQQKIEAVLIRRNQALNKAQEYQAYGNYAQTLFNQLCRKYAGKYNLEGTEYEYEKGKLKTVKNADKANSAK